MVMSFWRFHLGHYNNPIVSRIKVIKKGGKGGRGEGEGEEREPG